MRRLLEMRRSGSSAVVEKAKDADVEKGIGGGDKRRNSFYSERLWCKLEGKGTRAKFIRWLHNCRSVIEDWLFLALLGVLMALCSLAMDSVIEYLQQFHVLAIEVLNRHTEGWLYLLSTYATWTCFSVLLVTLSAFCVRSVAPQAIGSGIPEMKTILRGVILKEYLTLRTLISKMIGLTLSLGSGMPIGKEGPFVHIASVMANLLSQFVHTFSPFGNESRSYEMLAAACAVGVSSTFSAPVGGVLFSIEVTSVYFAVRNYWRGFFAATCSATVLRLFRVLREPTEVTVSAFYQTNFPTQDAFFPEELPFFALVGVLCGFLSAAFIWFQRQVVLFLRHNSTAKLAFQKHWLIYPALVSFTIGSLTFPGGFGEFLGGEKRFGQTPKDFFHICTWSALPNASNRCPHSLLISWQGDDLEYSHLVTLACFIFTYFFLTALASTVPIPCGIFGPSFVLGSAVGRLCGEGMVLLYPKGLHDTYPIYPGIYSVVGAAAFCGGVTHTVSVAVIVFELTGQLLHILPVMIAVLIANAICSYLQPSIYDSGIRIKRLPYLPDIPHNSSRFHGIRVDQFMTRDVQFFSDCTSFGQLRELLTKFPHLKAFPIVESQRSRILIGSCNRSRLLRALNARIGPRARQQEAQRRRNMELLLCRNRAEQETANKTPAPLEHHHTNSEPRLAQCAEAERALERAKRKLSVISFVSKRAMQRKESHQFGRQKKCFTVMPVASASGEVAPVVQKPNVTVRRSLTIPAVLGAAESSENSTSGTSATAHLDVYSTIGGMIRTLSRLSSRLRKDDNDEHDFGAEERAQWEVEQLSERVDFNTIGIDPAPFQLVESTSLVKVHSLFSLLGLNRAYVTKCGRLVGVVALRDLRFAIERVHSGELTADTTVPLLRKMQSMDVNSDDEDGTEETRDDSAENSDDETEDILNPRLEVVDQTDSLDGDQPRTESLRVRLQIRRTSEALKGAVVSLAKGMLAASGNNPTATAEEEGSAPHERSPSVLNARMSIPFAPPPVFVISSGEEELPRTQRKITEADEEEAEQNLGKDEVEQEEEEHSEETKERTYRRNKPLRSHSLNFANSPLAARRFQHQRQRRCTDVIVCPNPLSLGDPPLTTALTLLH